MEFQRFHAPVTTFACTCFAPLSLKSFKDLGAIDTDVFVLNGMLGVSGGDGMQDANGTVGYDNAGPSCLQ